jgi:small basic protein
MDYNSILLYGIPVLALVIGLVRVAREMGLPSRFAPAAALGLGVLGGVAVAYQQGLDPVAGIVIGIALGLMACGVYDQGKVSSPPVEPPAAG